MEERSVHTQACVVGNEAEFLEPIHKETHAGPRGLDHFGQHFLTDLRNDLCLLTVFPHMGQQQQRPRQPLLGRMKELIDQVFLDAEVARQEMGHEQLGERRLVMEHPAHGGPVDAHDRGAVQGGGGRPAHRLSGEAGFTEKIPAPQHRDDGFFALQGEDRELDPALQDIEHGRGRIPLRKEYLVFLALQRRSAVAGSCEKGLGIEWCGSCAYH